MRSSISALRLITNGGGGQSVNIGNARLYGMEEDLGLVGNQYQTAVSLLFVTYLLSELPSNLVLKKFRPSRWLSFIATRYAIAFYVIKGHAGVVS